MTFQSTTILEHIPKMEMPKNPKWMLDLCPGDFQVVWDDLMTPNGWICKCKLHQPRKPISTWIFHTPWDRLSVRLSQVNDTRGWKNPREREVWLWPFKNETHEEKVILVQNHLIISTIITTDIVSSTRLSSSLFNISKGHTDTVNSLGCGPYLTA